jgi:hypothetical protein
MNLKWSNVASIYFPRIVPGMGKHCDVGHIVDPTRRRDCGKKIPRLNLSDQEISLAFDVMAAPNYKGTSLPLAITS